MKVVLEECIQQYYENPHRWEELAKSQLETLGIELTLDNALALLWGITYGTIRTRIWVKVGKVSLEDIKEITAYALKEWPKLKEHYISQRLFR